jgi:hypothetical protein
MTILALLVALLENEDWLVIASALAVTLVFTQLILDLESRIPLL